MTISHAVVDVDGIQVLAQREYTSTTVKNSYEANMQVIRDFLSATTTPGTSPVTEQQLLTAIKNLRDLAINGIETPLDSSNPGGATKVYYLTEGMNQALDLLFRTLNVAGVTIPATGEIDTSGAATTSTWYQQWYNLGAATPLVQNALEVALTASQTNYSLQSMVELLYVKRANDQLGEKMGDLKDALQVTKETLSLLTNLQNLHNQIQVNNKPPFSTFFNIYTANLATFSSQYQSAASAYFGTPIVPSLVGDGYTIPTNYGFLNYIFNVSATKPPFEEDPLNPGSYLIKLLPDIQALLPAGFLAAYGLTETSTNTFTTTSTQFIKDAQFFSGQYIPGAPVIGPGSPKFSDFYTIDYNGIIAPGFDFTGTTQTNSQALYNGGGSSNLAGILSGAYGLNRDGLLSKIQELVKYRNALSAQIAALNISNPSGIGDANSLQGRLMVTLQNIKDVFKTATGDPITSATPLIAAYSGYKAWMIDNYERTGSSGNTAGEIQQNITNAITAGQSLNDTQKESVRQILFIFEEFYKSASAILQSLTQIIERLAQNLSRG